MKIFPRLFLYAISEHSFTDVRLLEENGNLHRNRKSKQLKFFLNSECKCLTFNKLFWALKPYFISFYFVILIHAILMWSVPLCRDLVENDDLWKVNDFLWLFWFPQQGIMCLRIAQNNWPTNFLRGFAPLRINLLKLTLNTNQSEEKIGHISRDVILSNAGLTINIIKQGDLTFLSGDLRAKWEKIWETSENHSKF
jgi:hypothetical protein